MRGALTWTAVGMAAAALGLSAPSLALGAARVGLAPASGPHFVNYATPATLPQDAGEPSIGVDWATGSAMFEASQNTFKVTFDDAVSPPRATWKEVTSPVSVFTADPILFVDPGTNRTFVSQLDIACSLSSYTDDDGASWVGPTQGCGESPPEDHQTVGGGPLHAPLSTGITYPHGVYYCHQDGVVGFVTADGQAAYCALSITGSIVYGPGVPIYTGLQCGGLHGHIKVAPDGTAYVPVQACDLATIDPGLPGERYTHQAVVVSEDNGTTWSIRSIPDSHASNYSDPSVGIASDGTVYFGYQDGGAADGTGRHPRVAVSHDRGVTWSSSVDVGTPFGIENTQFPEVVAGDANRAAFAFLGTPQRGDDQAVAFDGTWHLYSAFTYDGGATWSTLDVTPTDPVQRTCIQLVFAEPSPQCPHRNLLDFNDMTVDKQGRVLVAYADGCTAKCVSSAIPADNKFLAVGTIARQSCGKGLFVAQDGKIPACQAAATAPPPTTSGGGAPLPKTSASGGVAVLAGAVLLAVFLGLRPGRRRRAR